MEKCSAKAQEILDNLTKVMVGKEKACQIAILPLFCRGHVLLEDVPGVGKTTLAKTIARSVGGEFSRIQFTPDLLPLDITGSLIYNPKEGTFEFRHGPVFTNILLADEINRATPRTQSSLLECMEEFQVSMDGKTYPLPGVFSVFATMNPVEQMGTFPLPETQLDRFMIRISLGYPDEEDEVEIFDRQTKIHPLDTLAPVASPADILEIQIAVKEIYIDPTLKQYTAKLVRATRAHSEVILGCSPRATIHLIRVAQAYALLQGETFVQPDIIKKVAPYVLSHRLVLNPRATLEGKNGLSIINEIVNEIPVPIDAGN